MTHISIFIWPQFYYKDIQTQKQSFSFISSSLFRPAILVIRSRTKIRPIRIFLPGLEMAADFVDCMTALLITCSSCDLILDR